MTYGAEFLLFLFMKSVIPEIEVRPGVWKKFADDVNEVLHSQEWVPELKKSSLFRKLMGVHYSTYSTRGINKELSIIANETKLSLDDLRTVNLTYEICMFGAAGTPDLTALMLSVFKPVKAGCTSIVLDRGLSSAPLHMRNLDWPDPNGMLSKHLITARRPRHPKVGGTWRSIQWPGFAHSVTAFTNDFSISMNAVWCDQVALGRAPTALLREVAEDCKHYYDALYKLKTTPLNCGALFVLAGTKKGEAALIERTPRSYHVETDQEVLVVTNDYQHLDASAGSDSSEVSLSSCSRQNRVAALLEKTSESPEAAFGCDIIEDEEVKLGCTLHHTKMIPAEGVVEVWRP